MSANLTDDPQSTPGPSSFTAQPGARLALALLLAINLFNYIDRQVLAAVVPALEDEFFPKDSITGLRPPDTEESLGWLATAFMVTYMAIAPLFGRLADRMSPWLLVGVGVVIWSFASGGSGLAATFTILLLTRCLVGVGEAAYGPVAPTVIADLYPVQRRGYVLSWFYAAIPVGSALGYVLGGVMWQMTGDWRWAFYVVVPPGLLLGLTCFFMPTPRRGGAEATGPSRPARMSDYRLLLGNPSYILDTLGMTAMTFAMGGIAYWIPRYIVTDRRHLDLGQVNLIFGAIVVVTGLGATMLGGLAGDRLRPRFPGSYFLVSGVAMLAAFPMVLLILWTPFPLAWVFVALACFCLFFNTGPTNTILANVTHPSIRASAFAMNIFVIHALGDAISPWVIGRIARTARSIAPESSPETPMNVGFMGVSGLILIGGLLWLWGSRYLERDTALAPHQLDAARATNS